MEYDLFFILLLHFSYKHFLSFAFFECLFMDKSYLSID